MTMLPRIITSPIVSPSDGTGAIVSASITARPSSAWYRTPWRALISARSPAGRSSHSGFHEQMTDGP